MGKIITVCGGHGSGKTTVAANLGYMLAQNSLVGILSTNMVCGIIQHLFGAVIEDCRGLYEISLSKYDNAKAFVPCPNNKNLFLMSLANNHDCLMLADEENGINGDRAKEMLSDMKEMFEYLIVDCEPEINNPLSVYSIIYADKIVNLIKLRLQAQPFITATERCILHLKYRPVKSFISQTMIKTMSVLKMLRKLSGLKCFIQFRIIKMWNRQKIKVSLRALQKTDFISTYKSLRTA